MEEFIPGRLEHDIKEIDNIFISVEDVKSFKRDALHNIKKVLAF